MLFDDARLGFAIFTATATAVALPSAEIVADTAHKKNHSTSHNNKYQNAVERHGKGPSSPGTGNAVSGHG